MKAPKVSWSLRTVDYVVWALDRLGGAARPVDIEDIAIEAYRLAPHRFQWRKYPEQVDMAGVRDGLSDARKPENGALVTGDRKHGWTLTPSGIQHAGRINSDQPAPTQTDTERTRVDVPVRAAERHRVMSSSALRKVNEGRSDDVTKQDVRELLRVDQYVTDAKYAQRVSLVRNAVADEPELLRLIDELERRYREGGLSR